MKKIYCILFFLLFSDAVEAQEVFDNNKVIELTKIKFGDDLIIGLFPTSKCSFDCSISEIVKLKQAGVSEKVISEMLKIGNSKKIAEQQEKNQNNPYDMHIPGIYLHDENANVLKKLYASVVSGTQSGGFGTALAQSFTYGLAKSAQKSMVDGESANVKGRSDAIFYFYFEPSSQNGNLSNWWFLKATSPNEFALIKLDVKHSHREFTNGKSDAYTSKTGVDEKQKIPFTFEEIGSGIFKVVPKSPLKAGEYCFIYAATVPTTYSNDKIFDFSIF